MENKELMRMFLNSYPDGKTKQNYEVDIKQICKYAESINKNLLELTIDDCNEYFNSTEVQSYAGSTFNRKLTCISNFYKKMINRKLYNDITPINEVRYKDGTPEYDAKEKYIEPSDMKIIINYLKKKIKMSYTNRDKKIAYRNYTMFYLMFNSGFRRHEINTFKVSSVNFNNNTIVITKGNSKNNKAKVRQFSDKTMRILKEYIDFCEFKDDDYLFNSCNNNQLSDVDVNRIFTKTIDELCMKHITPHMVRHTFAKIYYMKTKDIVGLQEVLGHKKITSTERYVKNNFMSENNNILDIV